MTAGTVARWDDGPTRDVVDGWAVQLAEVARLAEYIAATDFVPKAYRGQPAAVAAAILAGREMGIGPMTALQHLYVVEGRPAMSAQLMRAQVLAAGHDLRVVESTAARCTVVGRRKGDSAEREPVTWSGDDVRRAGLANRPTWQRYPRQMLLARATAELCRAVFPDVLGGMTYAVEEAADIPADEGADVAPAPTTRKRIQRRPSAPPEDAAGLELPPSPPPGGAAATTAPPTLPSPGEAGPSPEPSSPPTPRRGGLPDAGEAGTAPDLPPLPDEAPRADLSAEPGEAVPAPPADAEAAPAPVHDRIGSLCTVPDCADVHDPADDEGAAADAPTPEPADDDADDDATGLQRGKVFALLTDLGAMHPRERRLGIVSALVGRTLTTTTELTRREAAGLIDTLVRIAEAPDPAAELEWLSANGTARAVLGAQELDQPPLPLDLP
jgi:hypothetical protein